MCGKATREIHGDMGWIGDSESAGPKKHDCVAYYISYAKGAKGMRTAKIEYFDDKGLENFFLNRPKENNGIVQKFEDSTSPYNTLLRAYWTPHKLQLQQRVNNNEMSDMRVVMNDRLSTFDGPEHLNVEFEIKSYKLKLRLTQAVTAIINHVKSLLPSAYTLWTMECFFKLSGKNKLLFLWCNDLRVFNTNEPPKIEAFLTPPVNSLVAPKHKYERKELKKEYFKCPCAGFHIDANCDKVGGLFHISQMKITTYRYMILFHQSQAPVEKDVSIPVDHEYSKLSPYRQRWIEEDEMVKFQENSGVKAYELKNGSLLYQQPRDRLAMPTELVGWQNIPPVPVSNADPLVFKFLSKLAVVDGKVVQAHNLTEYSKQDLADFRRFFTNIVQTDPHFLDRKMKVCDACCTRFSAAADDNMSVEMTKLVVGTPGDEPSLNSSLRQSTKSRLASTSKSSLSTTMPLQSSAQVIKTVSADQYLPKIKGAGRQRSRTALGMAAGGGSAGSKKQTERSLSVDPARRPGRMSKSLSGDLSENDLSVTTKSMGNTTRNVRMHAKNVREWCDLHPPPRSLRTLMDTFHCWRRCE